MKTIAVIGAGASGTLVCAQLPASSNIQWIGDEERFGPGLAFGTQDPEHLLNVRANGMSAFPDQPLHFFEWVTRRHPELKASEADFIPRMLYGEYLEELVPLTRPGLVRHSGQVIDVERVAHGFDVHLASGERIAATDVVLAMGNLSGAAKSGAYLFRELEGIRPEDRIFILGTGLTMIDMILSLRARGHRGPITAMSRRGLVPRVHTAYRPHLASDELKALFAQKEFRLARALHLVRRECRLAEKSGSDWRAVMDLFRPHTAALWSRLGPRERRRFIRHLRAYWDVHRHRAAPDVHRKIMALQEQGILKVLKGRHRPEGPFDRVLDCTGLITDMQQARSPLMHALFRRGLVKLDDPAIGIHAVDPGIHVIGPLLRGQLWESVAVPEIRCQAHDIVTKLV